MTALIKYDAACKALAQCRTVDEVKKIRDQAEAMRLYGRMAKDTTLEADAAEIRLRAERRLGQLIDLQRKTVGLNKGGRPTKTGAKAEPVSRPTLKDAGIDKKLSTRAQRIGGIAERAFEMVIKNVRKRIANESTRRSALDVLQFDKKHRRAQREAQLGDKQRALPDRKFGVILADPEWKHVPWSDTGMAKSADNHYPTTPTDEICARPVETIAADDCILFLWATVPMLLDALKVMAAWGFTYKSHAIWRKQYPGKQQGMGYWFRINHELLLVGTRGNIPCPSPGENWGSVIDAPVGKHSVKPDKFYELIETYFPKLPKIELNARRERKGWDAWGNEAPEVPQREAAE